MSSGLDTELKTTEFLDTVEEINSELGADNISSAESVVSEFSSPDIVFEAGSVEPTNALLTSVDNTQAATVEEWGDFESNCSDTSAHKDTAPTYQVELQSALVTTGQPLPRHYPPAENTFNDGGVDNSSSTVASIEDMSEAPNRTIDIPGTPGTSKPKKSHQIKRVQFGEDKITIYETSSSPNRVLDFNNISEEKTTLTYVDGSVYNGQCLNGRRHGRGICTYLHSSIVYDGEWQDDMKHGTGKITYADGTVFEGEFKFGRKDGSGTLYYSNGGLYVGNFRDNKKNGKGKYVGGNGDLYVGGWKDGVMHGQGLWQGVNGDWYEGEYRNGLRHGQGTFSTPSGERYVGDWELGYRSGQGRLKRGDGGLVYEGGFAEDMKHGKGQLISEEEDGTDKVELEGVWHYDELISSSSRGSSSSSQFMTLVIDCTSGHNNKSKQAVDER